MADWDFRQTLACNSTMKALIDANWQRHKLDMAYNAFISSYYCRQTGNATLIREADRIWVVYNNWGYWPSNKWAMFTLVTFGLSALFHIYQILRSRYWSFIMVVMGCGGEMYGWSMRWIGGQNLLNGLTWWLFGIEFFTLLVQVGGGATAAGADDASTFNVGSWIMLGGIVAQLVVTLIFLAIFGIFFSRLRSRHDIDILYADKNLKTVFWGIIAISSLIAIRGAYRIAELSEGMFGPIAYSQVGLILGDCIPMLAVTYIFNVIHPLYTLRNRNDQVFSIDSVEEYKLGRV
ncbi:hypothetical protein JCM10295v2_002543 [Rhodotorula toruloides]